MIQTETPESSSRLLFSRIVRKKGTLSAGMASSKDDISLKFSQSAFTHMRRAYLRIKPTQRTAELRNEDEVSEIG